MGFPSGSTIKNLPAMLETQVWSLGQEDALEEGMAVHYIILAWRIPRTEESGGLQSLGSQRVRHDWVSEHAHMHPHVSDSVKDSFKLLVGLSQAPNKDHVFCLELSLSYTGTGA